MVCSHEWASPAGHNIIDFTDAKLVCRSKYLLFDGLITRQLARVASFAWLPMLPFRAGESTILPHINRSTINEPLRAELKTSSQVEQLDEIRVGKLTYIPLWSQPEKYMANYFWYLLLPVQTHLHQ
jgi:hypothetical protein